MVAPRYWCGARRAHTAREGGGGLDTGGGRIAQSLSRTRRRARVRARQVGSGLNAKEIVGVPIHKVGGSGHPTEHV